ncbi:MAG: hypothetical protein ACQUHE_05245 [Bacteroidia bacterium]
MKTNNNIRTLAELQNEIHRLKADYKFRGVQLKDDTNSYFKQFTLGNLIKKYATPSGFLKFDEKTNISSKIMSIVLPMLLNSTVFRGSGLITKAVGALVSGKIGKSIDAGSLSGAFNMIKSLFTGKKPKAKADVAFIDYGIPPDSETY